MDQTIYGGYMSWKKYLDNSYYQSVAKHLNFRAFDSEKDVKTIQDYARSKGVRSIDSQNDLNKIMGSGGSSSSSSGGSSSSNSLYSNQYYQAIAKHLGIKRLDSQNDINKIKDYARSKGVRNIDSQNDLNKVIGSSAPNVSSANQSGSSSSSFGNAYERAIANQIGIQSFDSQNDLNRVRNYAKSKGVSSIDSENDLRTIFGSDYSPSMLQNSRTDSDKLSGLGSNAAYKNDIKAIEDRGKADLNTFNSSKKKTKSVVDQSVFDVDSKSGGGVRMESIGGVREAMVRQGSRYSFNRRGGRIKQIKQNPRYYK